MVYLENSAGLRLILSIFLESQLMRGWETDEKVHNIEKVREPWLKGFFASSHTDWDGVTWSRNYSELRARDIAVFALGDIDGRRILDVGCGDGTYSVIFSELGANVSGQDINPQNIAIAGGRSYGKKNILKGEFVCGDATELSFESNAFDCVFSADFFEHIDMDTKRRVLREIYRVLKPGGVLVIKTPNLDYLRLSIFVKRVFAVLTFRSPFLHIPHTRNNPDNEHFGLINFRGLSEELEAAFFHTPDFKFYRLHRRGLPIWLQSFLLGLKTKHLTEHIIISTRKAVFKAISDSYN